MKKLAHLVDKMIETVKISLEYDLPNFREETLLLSAIENILNNEKLLVVMKQITEVEEKPFTLSLNICLDACGRKGRGLVGVTSPHCVSPSHHHPTYVFPS
jgi:hypothetical protein